MKIYREQAAIPDYSEPTQPSFFRQKLAKFIRKVENKPTVSLYFGIFVVFAICTSLELIGSITFSMLCHLPQKHDYGLYLLFNFCFGAIIIIYIFTVCVLLYFMCKLLKEASKVIWVFFKSLKSKFTNLGSTILKYIVSKLDS